MKKILENLNMLLHKSRMLNESGSTDDVYTEIDPEYSTAEQGIHAAAEQIAKTVFKDKDGSGGGGSSSEMSIDDDPSLPELSKSKGGGGPDKTFKSSTFDDDISGGDSLDDEDGEESETELDDEDFEFDDFDYDESKSESGGGDDDETPSESTGDDTPGDDDYDYEDGDFDDSEMGDEDDYDFGDGDDDGDTGGEDGDEDGSESGKSGKSGKGGSSGGSPSSDGDDDIDYEDTLDYDSEDYDSLESEIKDAFKRMKDGTKSKSIKDALDKMEDKFNKEDGKSSAEKAKELSDEIDSKKNDESTGEGELAGESLDKEPDDKAFEEDMKEAGFDDKDIADMKHSKKEDKSGDIDEEKLAKEAAMEMDKRAKEKKGDSKAVSSLSRSILRSVLKGKLERMEWQKMVEMFLKSKSPLKGHLAKSTKTGWGDKKHLWRDAVLPKKSPGGGDVRMISCFVDFSGSVSQPLVFTFLNKVLKLCDKFTYTEVNVYGFGEKLSTPKKVTGKEIKSKDPEVLINEIWEFIENQELGGMIENFDAVATEIMKIKKKDFDSAIFIFGDGLWGVSYANPEPPIRLKEKAQRFLKDILCLVYYYPRYTDIVAEECEYLKQIVGINNIVTTTVDDLK